MRNKNMNKKIKFDVECINPLNHQEIFYGFEAESPQEACDQVPYWLAVSSQWKPDQFKVISAKLSIQEEKK